ncbi:unnamed protein product [Urochloa humidicola]
MILNRRRAQHNWVRKYPLAASKYCTILWIRHGINCLFQDLCCSWLLQDNLEDNLSINDSADGMFVLPQIFLPEGMIFLLRDLMERGGGFHI